MLNRFIRVLLLISIMPWSAAQATPFVSDNRVHVVDVDPFMSPVEYRQQYPDVVGMVPDGAGLQIFYYANHHYYLIGGPRSNRLLTVNGGKIEDANAPFWKQLQEEFDEETFGSIKIENLDHDLYLTIGNNRYPLQIDNKKTLIVERPGVFAYVTFTAVVTDLDKSDVISLANQMSPTAYFWEAAGSFLFTHVRAAPKDETFSAYWQQQKTELNNLLANLTTEYDRLIQAGTLLITPEQAFNVTTLEAAWEQLRNLNSYAALKYCFQNTVGRYSERKGYFVFDANQLLEYAGKDNAVINDIDGHPIAQGLFNSDAITLIFPLILQEAATLSLQTS